MGRGEWLQPSGQKRQRSFFLSRARFFLRFLISSLFNVAMNGPSLPKTSVTRTRDYEDLETFFQPKPVGFPGRCLEFPKSRTENDIPLNTRTRIRHFFAAM